MPCSGHIVLTEDFKVVLASEMHWKNEEQELLHLNDRSILYNHSNHSYSFASQEDVLAAEGGPIEKRIEVKYHGKQGSKITNKILPRGWSYQKLPGHNNHTTISQCIAPSGEILNSIGQVERFLNYILPTIKRDKNGQVLKYEIELTFEPFKKNEQGQTEVTYSKNNIFKVLPKGWVAAKRRLGKTGFSTHYIAPNERKDEFTSIKILEQFIGCKKISKAKERASRMEHCS